MTNKERIVAALNKEPSDVVPFAARIDQWYNWHLKKGSLPERYSGLHAYEILRAIGTGIRPAMYNTPGQPAVRRLWSRMRGAYREEYRGTEVRSEENGDEYSTEFLTPEGRLRLAERFTEETEGGWSIESEHLFKDPRDYPALEFLYGNVVVYPDFERYRSQEAELGDDGVPITTIGYSPVHQLMRSVMGYERFFYELADNRSRVESLLAVMESAWLKRVDILAQSPAVTIQVGGNWCNVIHLPVFEKYMLPWFQKICEILHGAGKLVQVHVDGEMKGLLELFLKTGIDIAEAVAPSPMTSVRLEEFRQVWGNKVTFWGGLPSVIFEPNFPEQEYKDYVATLMRLYKGSDCFILGMGDNLPPSGDIGRVERAAELIKTTQQTES